MSGFRTPRSLVTPSRQGAAPREVGTRVLASWGRRPALLASSVALALFGLSLTISFVVTPEDIESKRVVLSPTCHLKALLGRECPTCGLTRAFSALSHGRFDDARRYNRASPALYTTWWAAAATALTTFLRSLFTRNESRKIPT